MRTNDAIVTNHDLVVDFDTISDNGVIESASVDGCVGSDLYIVTDKHNA
jgi:hypothetical protein